MDGLVAMDLSTWHGLRARDPRRLALGTAQWGMRYGIANRTGAPDAAERARMLARAAAAGIRTIDTARAYGHSEARVGAALAAAIGGATRSGAATDAQVATPRGGWCVVTKLAPDAHEPGLDIADTLARVAGSLAASRAALGRDALPVLLLHRFGHRHACGGKLWRTLLGERDAGRIGRLGVSAANPDEAWAALEDPDVEVLQVASSLLDLRLLRQGFFGRARELGRTVYVRSVFLQGVATLDPDCLPGFLAPAAEPLRQIGRTARELGVAPRTLFLAFAREMLPGAHPVVGCERDEQLAELIEDWGDDRIDLARLGPLVESLPTLDAEVVDPSRWPATSPPRAARPVSTSLDPSAG